MNQKAYRLMSIMVMLALTFGWNYSVQASSLVAPLMSANAYYVSTTGNDANVGTLAFPFRTIQKAVDAMVAGDVTTVLPGNYSQGVNISKSGITLIASGKVVIKGVYVNGDLNTVSGFVITDPLANAGIEVHGDHNLFEKNEIYHTAQDGIWYFGSYNTFRSNYIHDILDPSVTFDQHVDCFQTWGWDHDTTYDVFEGNLCDHTRETGSNQISMMEVQGGRIVGNIIFRNNIFIMHDAGYSPMAFWGTNTGQLPITNISILNNLIIHVNGIGYEGIRFANVQGAVVKNNVFYDYGNTSFPYVYSYDGSTNIQIGNNLIYKSDGVPPTGGAFPGDVWMQSPQFVDFNGFDFHLQSNSPAIDKGVEVGVLNDFDGISRPQGLGYDIGAYEYAGTGINTSTPTNAPTFMPSPTSTLPIATITSFPTLVPPTTTPTAMLPTATLKATSQPVSGTRYDDKNGGFIYSSGWLDVPDLQSYGSSYKRTSTKASTVSFVFTGQSFSILYVSGPNNRNVDVFVDGVLVGTINETASATNYQVRWDFPGQLTPGTHTLKLVTKNKPNNFTTFDAVIVY